MYGFPKFQTTMVDLGDCILSFDGMMGQGNPKSFCKSHSDKITNNNRAHNKINNIFLNNQDRNKKKEPTNTYFYGHQEVALSYFIYQLNLYGPRDS